MLAASPTRFGILAGIAGALLLLAGCGPPVDEGGYHYRMVSRYEWKATGEVIEVDVVVACGGRYSQWGTRETTFGVRHHPMAYFVPDPVGGALMVSTLAACGDDDFARWPADVQPRLVHYLDADHLTVGWGYVTEAAYDSPHGQVRHLGTTLAPATREEWAAWRKEKAAAWEPFGMVPGPWGYSFDRSGDRLNEALREASYPYAGIGNTCFAYQRVPWPAELIEAIAAERPDRVGGGRFLVVGGDQTVAEVEALKRIGTIVDDYRAAGRAAGKGRKGGLPNTARWLGVEQPNHGSITYEGGGVFQAMSYDYELTGTFPQKVYDADETLLGLPEVPVPGYVADLPPWPRPYEELPRVADRRRFQPGPAGYEAMLLTDERYDGFAVCMYVVADVREVAPKGRGYPFYVDYELAATNVRQGTDVTVYDVENDYIYLYAQ